MSQLVSNIKVYIVGAGPGDYKLLTLKAIECLKRAEVVVYDALVSKQVEEFVPSLAKKLYVGKRDGLHSIPQEEINNLLIKNANEGKVVIRLKGGDPFVFGRGGEEAIALAGAGIPFEVVPGVTSAIAVPAYAGIPVSHRNISSAFAVVTGHEYPNKPNSQIPFDALAKIETVIFLMGLGKLEANAKKLISSGKDPSTPSALVEYGTYTRQRVIVASLGSIYKVAKNNSFRPPCVFIVGNVVNLRKEIGWFECLPLFGEKVMVTRAKEQSEEMVTYLESLGAQVVEFPTIKINPLLDLNRAKAFVRNIESYDLVIFTSQNTVDILFDQFYSMGLDARVFGNLKVAAIGAKTSYALRQRGIIADIVPKIFQAEYVLGLILDNLPGLSRVIIPRAKKARDVLENGLRIKGMHVDVEFIYETVMPDVNKETFDAIDMIDIDWITFTSPSTVDNFFKLIYPFKVKFLKTARMACIGKITADALLRHGYAPDIIAEESTAICLSNVMAAANRS